MLTGIVTSRCFSLGTVGIRPVIGKGPKKPLVVQYTPLTCADTAEEPKAHTPPSNAAAMTAFFICASPLCGPKRGVPGPVVSSLRFVSLATARAHEQRANGCGREVDHSRAGSFKEQCQ